MPSFSPAFVIALIISALAGCLYGRNRPYSIQFINFGFGSRESRRRNSSTSSSGSNNSIVVRWERHLNSSCLRSHHYRYYMDASSIIGSSTDRDNVEFHVSYLLQHTKQPTAAATAATNKQQPAAAVTEKCNQKKGSKLYLNGIQIGAINATCTSKNTGCKGKDPVVAWNTNKYSISPSILLNNHQAGAAAKNNQLTVDIVTPCSTTCVRIESLQIVTAGSDDDLLAAGSSSHHSIFPEIRIRKIRKWNHNNEDEDEVINNQHSSNSEPGTRQLTAGASTKSTQQQELWCRITMIESMVTGGDKKETEETGCIPFEEDSEIESDELYPVRLPKHIFDSHVQEIEKGTLFVRIQGAKVRKYKIKANENAVYKVIDPPARLRHLSVMEPAQGNKTIAIIRVSTRDSSPPASLDELVNGIVGHGVTMKTQYQRCSMGKLNWIFAGGYDVMLHDHSINDFNSGAELLGVAQETFRRGLNLPSISTIANKVLFCMAPGIHGWIAAAGVNHYRVNVNGDWCLSLSVAMHEIGHTLGLIHSAEGEALYGDETGYMGYGDRSEKWPRKCFNGAKNWQLQWYEEKQLQVNPFVARFITLSSFVDYDKAKANEPCLLNIGGMYFLQFNRARKFNGDTEEKADLVTITKDEGTRSESVAGLAVGEKFVVENYKDTGRTLVVKVCYHRKTKDDEEEENADQAEAMILSIGIGRAYCKQWFASGMTATVPAWTRCILGRGKCSLQQKIKNGVVAAGGGT